MSWVLPDDVTDSWVGSSAPTDLPKLQIWIDRAERLVRRRVPDLQQRIDEESDLDPSVSDLLDTTKDVVIAMVTEVFKNPDGKRSVGTTTGPFTENVTFGGDDPGKLLFLPEYEDLLSGVNPGEAYTVDLIAGHSEPRAPFWGWL